VNFNAAIGVRSSRIVVVLAIDDDELRSRALRALDGIDQRFIHGTDFAAADVVICDHLPEAGDPQIGSPLLVIGDRPMIDEAVRRGYAGGLLPSFSDAKLLAAIEAVMHGLVCMDGGGEAMPTFDDEADAEPPLAELTVREAEVLRQLMTGASNKEIARRLDISVHTAKFHVASIVGKLGASGRTEAVARALRLARSMI
jgi:DNA-binding NarL/FixJ family response regulator